VLDAIPLALTVLALAAYLTALARLRQRGDRWPPGRTACLLAGSLCVAAALLPPVASHDELFPVHAVQHLLLGMAGPALLALSAPLTLFLRTLPRRPRRVLLRLLHSRAGLVLSRPAVVVALDTGGLSVLYLTGLYRAAGRDDLIHAAVHLHLFVAGCLFSWMLISVDPIRRRPGTRARLIALGVAAAAHDTLTRLMYAHALPAGGGTVAARHLGAELMYYGGTIVDVALAVILMAQWYRATGRALARERRREAGRAVPAGVQGAGPPGRTH
jgi:putative membrane protein